ncbi:cytochrome c oxidase accessory protein CcoG [Persicimonas caeni]|uniref:Cytochrome c oxidase accessory protein CcoG n=1 Tax=Persicimonas caeni TaxID=2292766 RepID=A0A4Y6PZC8_PERCE|nr:cytochrome c oxidase accessory protein CcoG [Persicimonas caeni]QDG53681.1 cytochrome c oxidase accessory protein CcoG [Persicimonas caeni]QED34902.1 cytochrome c oxidase accessory protein CcoG [Persicimonas caeni]
MSAPSTTDSNKQKGGVPDAPIQVLSTMTNDGKRRWLYPVLSKGKHFWRRLAVAVGLIALFLALPVVHVGGNPAVFLDVIHREFHFFGLTLYPTDTILLMVFLLLSLLGVFILTAFLGRVWCGWGCPQTVYLEFVFRPIERLIEGREMQRKRRDEGPWNFDKIWRKGAKWGIFAAIAIFLSHAFLAYFVSWDSLLAWMGGSPGEHFGVFFAMLLVSGLIFFDFAYFREQMCTITCPYARLQSALQDKDSMIVAYDPNRGEPRGRRTRELRKKEKAGLDIPLGDCIDCGACVRTCPTGIDIREGLQMECIACTQCIDACNGIMEGIGKPHGLIRYSSEHAIEDNKPTRIIRPRTIAYGLVWTALLSAFVWMLAGREPLHVDVGRIPGAPFTMIDDDSVANRVRFRMRNQTGEKATFHIEPITPKSAEVKVVGQPDIVLDHGEMRRVETFVVAPKADFGADGQIDSQFRVVGPDGIEQVVDFTLMGPSKQL